MLVEGGTIRVQKKGKKWSKKRENRKREREREIGGMYGVHWRFDAASVTSYIMLGK